MKREKVISEQQALLKMGALCSGAEYCFHDIEQKLIKMNQSREAIERILARLEKDGYIDESRYCRAYMRDKLRYNGWGKLKISMMLSAKHIDRSTISEALSEIDDEEYIEILKNLINAKRKSVKAASDYERNVKLMKFVASRGFEMSLAGKYLNTEDYEDEF